MNGVFKNKLLLSSDLNGDVSNELLSSRYFTDFFFEFSLFRTLSDSLNDETGSINNNDIASDLWDSIFGRGYFNANERLRKNISLFYIGKSSL